MLQVSKSNHDQDITEKIGCFRLVFRNFLSFLFNKDYSISLCSVVLKVCDELDKATPLHDYYKRRLTQHI